MLRGLLLRVSAAHCALSIALHSLAAPLSGVCLCFVPQHTPLSRYGHNIRLSLYIQYLVAESYEFTPLQRFGKEISNHVIWAVLHPDVARLDSVHDKEVANVHVVGPFTAGGLTILGKPHHTLMFLANTILNLIPLRFKKIRGPEDLRHTAIHPNKFCFCGASCVQFLSCGSTITCPFSKG